MERSIAGRAAIVRLCVTNNPERLIDRHFFHFESSMWTYAHNSYPNNKRNTLNTFLRLVFGIYLDPMGIIAYLPNLKVVGRCAVVEPRCGVRPFRSRTS